MATFNWWTTSDIDEEYFNSSVPRTLCNRRAEMSQNEWTDIPPSWIKTIRSCPLHCAALNREERQKKLCSNRRQSMFCQLWRIWIENENKEKKRNVEMRNWMARQTAQPRWLKSDSERGRCEMDGRVWLAIVKCLLLLYYYEIVRQPIAPYTHTQPLPHTTIK